jgi:hypothetical protein
MLSARLSGSRLRKSGEVAKLEASDLEGFPASRREAIDPPRSCALPATHKEPVTLEAAKRRKDCGRCDFSSPAEEGTVQLLPVGRRTRQLGEDEDVDDHGEA